MKDISRRDFLRYCSLGAAALGLSVTDLGRLEKVLANPNGPAVVWLQGSGCTGCSESLLNRISTSSPQNAASLLIDAINLVYHPTLMALPGHDAVAQAEAVYNKGGYVLAVEGGVPTAYNGCACWAWTDKNDVEVTFQDALSQLAGRAAKILCIGTCASWGGIPAAPPNPTNVMGVKAVTGKTTINIAGCPPHPDWIAWTVAQLLLNNPIPVDSYGRPTQFFSKTVHSQCPRREQEDGRFGRDGGCLEELGCRGPETRANCPKQLWNNGANWCIDANAPCLGCTEPTFPGTRAFYQGED